jgi:hypothetical protein
MFMKKLKESGVRPAISLAIANGDAELAHSALDLLWKFSEHRNWFKFKFPIMVLTKAFYLFPMYIEFMKRKPKEDKEAYKKFLTLLTVCKKDDRVEKTYKLMQKPRKSNEYKNKLMAASRHYFGMSCSIHDQFGNDAVVACMIVDDPYNREIGREICKLINRGGTHADLQKYSIGILAYALEGMPKEKILDQVKTEMKRVLEKPKKFKTKILKKPFLKKCKHGKKNTSN